jgi:hypothetical protein
MENSYRRLALAISINTVIMFFLMYTMIDRIDHFHIHINNIFMALLMAAPMVIVMLVVMRPMFMNRRLNTILVGIFGVVIILFYFLIRSQTPVGNEQFLRSMIPHHSSAILMCERSVLTDPEIADLCVEIVQTQEDEITQMEAILERYR